MNQVICIASPGSVGGTFLDWSINFLNGLDDHYCVSSQSWEKLTTNPLSSKNAHVHNKNHPRGLVDIKRYVTHALSVPGTVTLYPTLLSTDQACKQLNIDVDNLNSGTQAQILEFQTQDYKTALEYIDQHNIKIVVLDRDARLPLYNSLIRSTDCLPFTDKLNPTSDQITNHVNQLFFADSIKTWEDLNLTNIWDKREQLALCTRPFEDQYIKLGLDFKHLRINCQTFWHSGPVTIQRIMDFLSLNIQSDRFKKWLPIYNEWHQLQCKLLQFHYDYPHIINAIVNNWYLEIDLTFEQEIIVQHCLIYHHGLNLKTWNLSKFPNNTQDLYKLLEPNIHSLV